MKKALSFILSIVILISSLSVGINAFAESNGGHSENPFYTGEINMPSFKPLFATNSDEPDYYIYNGVKYYTDNDALYKIIGKALGARKESFSVKYYYNSRIYNSRNIVANWFQKSTDDRISSSSTDGDYARWSVSDYDWSYSYERDSEGYYYTFNLTFNYYSTNEQEKEVDKKINSIVNSVRKMNMSDYETVTYIHDLICDSTSYDYNAEKYATSAYDYAFTAYGALCKGKSVCQGYANAFYRICKELGFNVRFVSSNPYEGRHAWNLIQLDDKFYFVDATWDDEIRDDPEMQVGFDDNLYYFFLVDYGTLCSLDTNGQHTLYKALYNDDYYFDNYQSKTSKAPYNFDEATGLSTYTIALSNSSFVYNGKKQTPAITVVDKLGNPVDSCSLSYSNSTNCGRAKATITDQNGIATYRTYNILPAKMTDLSYSSNSRTSSSLTLKWTKYAGGADGYEIQQYKSGSWKTIKTLGAVTSSKITGLSSNTTVKFRIRAYKLINNYKNYGSYSNTFTTFTIPKNVSAPTLSTMSRAITVKWKKVTCSGYEIQYSQKSSMSNAKKISASYKLNSKKISKLKKGKKYYVRIRAYKTYNNKKYYSAWSSKKSITVK